MKRPWKSKKAKELAKRRTDEAYERFKKKHGTKSRYSGRGH